MNGFGLEIIAAGGAPPGYIYIGLDLEVDPVIQDLDLVAQDADLEIQAPTQDLELDRQVIDIELVPDPALIDLDTQEAKIECN